MDEKEVTKKDLNVQTYPAKVKYVAPAFDDIEEELESMEPDELVAYAAEVFEAMLNKYKSSETLVDEIMVLFERAKTNDCRVKFGYQNN